jgi:hypothetical protein
MALKLAVVLSATGKTVEIYADPTDTIADLKRLINEREGFASGEHPLCRMRPPANDTGPDGGPNLKALTRALGATVKNLPADAPERQKQLEVWLSKVDKRLGRGGASGPDVAAAPRSEARVLLDDWDVARCRLREGEVLSYGPWCPAQTAALGLGGDADSPASAAQRTERAAVEQDRILDGLLAPVLAKRKAAVIDLVLAKDDSQDRAVLDELTAGELAERVIALESPSFAALEQDSPERQKQLDVWLSKLDEKLKAAAEEEADSTSVSAQPGGDGGNDDTHRLAKLGYDLRVAVSRGFLEAVKQHIADGYATHSDLHVTSRPRVLSAAS